MDGSNGKIIALLERIAAAQEATRQELVATRQTLRGEIRESSVQVNGRLDNMLRFLGGHHDDHEQRIRALEEHVFKKSG